MCQKIKILLTGASGAVGLELLSQLFQLRDKYEITVFDLRTKKNQRTLSPYHKEVEIVYGDISKFDDVKKVCSNKDIVIHLAAIIPPLADIHPELAYSVNSIGTENLVRNLEKLSPASFLLYSSSISIYGDRIKNPYINVSDPIFPSEGDEYAKTKIKAEQIIQGCKLDWSIFRLTAIMGKHQISKLMFHMPLDTSIEIATPEDTARAFILAIEKRELIAKKIFNLGGGKFCRTTYKEFLSSSFDIFGLGKLNFPDKTFADKNFHCGFYEDGDELENILHFRKDSLDSYYRKVKLSTPYWKKGLSILFRKLIKKRLLKQSEPYHAYILNDLSLKHHFFNDC